ncbi:hypothetical protein [Vibrio vulnificus YJ016]|uniref:Uncharacterized protein n=1 Tax=Vibrio vulnificus (strain YJ016) TaxID=196600 RepID=Q7MCA5_VIBVY|nr:hypothetical protein [Vibrio vulnificus YJ016]
MNLTALKQRRPRLSRSPFSTVFSLRYRAQNQTYLANESRCIHATKQHDKFVISTTLSRQRRSIHFA